MQFFFSRHLPTTTSDSTISIFFHAHFIMSRFFRKVTNYVKELSINTIFTSTVVLSVYEYRSFPFIPKLIFAIDEIRPSPSLLQPPTPARAQQPPTRTQAQHPAHKYPPRGARLECNFSEIAKRRWKKRPQAGACSELVTSVSRPRYLCMIDS